MSPFGRMSVLTFKHSMSYMRLIASLICLLFARASTTKTSVLLDSIFANAFSFASGCFKICGENQGRQNHRRQSSRSLSRFNRFVVRREAVEFSLDVALDGKP